MAIRVVGAENWSNRAASSILHLQKALASIADEQEYVHCKRQIEWMRATRMAVVVSEEQGEVDKFRKWELDITPHRKLIKDGFELARRQAHRPR